MSIYVAEIHCMPMEYDIITELKNLESFMMLEHVGDDIYEVWLKIRGEINQVIESLGVLPHMYEYWLKIHTKIEGIGTQIKSLPVEDRIKVTVQRFVDRCVEKIIVEYAFVWVASFWKVFLSVNDDDVRTTLKLDREQAWYEITLADFQPWADAWFKIRNDMEGVMKQFYEENGNISNEWDDRWTRKSMTSDELARSIGELNQTLKKNERWMDHLSNFEKNLKNSATNGWNLIWSMYVFRKWRLEKELSKNTTDNTTVKFEGGKTGVRQILLHRLKELK